jgi:hypothetical protein
LKLLKKRVGNTLQHIGIGNNFSNRTAMAQQLRKKHLQMGLHETQKLLHSKRNGRKLLIAVIMMRDYKQNLQRTQKTKLPKNQ